MNLRRFSQPHLPPATIERPISTMKLTYDPNLYDLDDGIALAYFHRVDEFTADPRTAPKAASYGPSLKWEFVCVDGPNSGKPASVLTANRPSPKNSCLRMISGLAGKPIGEHEEIDTNRYLNRYYRIVIHDGRMSPQHAPMFMGVTLDQARNTFKSMQPPEAGVPVSEDTPAF